MKIQIVLNHSHSCCSDRAEMLKQHRELSMFVRRTIENKEKARIRPTVSGHCKLNFIEKDMKNYITRKVQFGFWFVYWCESPWSVTLLGYTLMKNKNIQSFK
ncbi:hypothetical protein Ahy_B04g069752 [Arachis hypogaea]|uniref:Uncharacterized protein n=1 Tax=Arachis hypogaea TaxID=3818 RepID=A0A444ZDH2_ARAHY|nr:hypothetical protein Ahy_B04g069752 [Arachis hypogaea]